MTFVSYGVGGWMGMLMAYLWARKYDRSFIEALPVAGICATLGASVFFLFAELLVLFGNMILFTIMTMLRPEILVFAGIPILSLELVLHFGDAALLGLIGMKPIETANADEIEEDTASAPTPPVSENSSSTESSTESESSEAETESTDGAHADNETATSNDNAVLSTESESTDTDGSIPPSSTDLVNDATLTELPVSELPESTVWPVQ